MHHRVLCECVLCFHSHFTHFFYPRVMYDLVFLVCSRLFRPLHSMYKKGVESRCVDRNRSQNTWNTRNISQHKTVNQKHEFHCWLAGCCCHRRVSVVLLSLSLSQTHTDGRTADDYQNLYSQHWGLFPWFTLSRFL